MTKRLSAVVGEYTKDGQQKAEWENVGVLGIDKNGNEYVLLDAGKSLAGLLVKQNVLAQKRGEEPRDMLMTKVFEDNNQGQQSGGYQQQSGYQNQNQGGFQNQQQGGYQQAKNGGYNQQ